ncbi:MAG: hypothetical protein ABJF07_25740, partial [Nisaea sp.]
MSNRLPQISLAALPSPPPPGSIQFFDGYFPALPAGTYNINVTHTVSGSGAPPPFSLPQQSFTVRAPEFSINTDIVKTIYPPAGNTDVYDQNLPFIVLNDPSLPWERALVPDSPDTGSGDPVPWTALLIFADQEMVFPPGSDNPVSTCKVSQFLASDPNVLKPDLPSGWVSSAQMDTTCKTITIPGAVFNAVLPSKNDLRYLVHCRSVFTVDEGEHLLSVQLCNRLAVADTAANPATPVRYNAHLVSLEGYADYLPGGSKTIPNKASGGLQDVQLVSLYGWSFVSQPETGQSFKAIVEDLIASEASTEGALSLPVPANPDLPSHVKERLTDGYAPLKFVAGEGDESFAWYRGPFSAVLPQTLPEIGAGSAPVAQTRSAEALMIYLSEQGLFDLSYAAAWNLGRGLALADAGFVRNLMNFRQAATQALTALAQRISMPLHSGVPDPRQLLARKASRRRFKALMADGLGRQWTEALAGVRQSPTPAASTVQRTTRARKRTMLHPAEMLTHPGATEAISESLEAVKSHVSEWLDDLALLRLVPFSYLVPDPKMLPTESIRFFYVDPNWAEALVAGALSIGIQSSRDVALFNALLPAFKASGGKTMSGMLIRSQLVSGWPELVVSASLGGAPMPIRRNELMSPNVRLVLFDGIPDTVTLAEPYQGLVFGIEDAGVYPRCVTSSALAGAVIGNVSPVPATTRAPTGDAIGGVLKVATVASALETAVGATPFDSNSKINWNEAALTTTYVNGNQLTATVTKSHIANPATADVTVASGGVTSHHAVFTITPPLAIESFEPEIIRAGAGSFTLTVWGTGFGADAEIQWNGNALTGTKVVSAAEARVTVPAGDVATAGPADISVSSSGQESNAETLKIISGDPVIDTLEPNTAMAGATGLTLTVLGAGFDRGAVVKWNGSAFATHYESDQKLTAAVPKTSLGTAGQIDVTVEANNATSPSATFTIADRTPTIG